MAQLPKGGLVRGHDKPIHGSCAIYFPGSILFLKTAMFLLNQRWLEKEDRSFFRITWTHKCYEGILIKQYSMSFVSWKENMNIWISWGAQKPHLPTLYTSNQKGISIYFHSPLHQNSNHLFQPKFFGIHFFQCNPIRWQHWSRGENGFDGGNKNVGR